MSSRLLALITARDPSAMSDFYDDHAGAVRLFCATVCPSGRVDEAIRAAFVDFFGRTLEAEAGADPSDLLRRATREVAASRIDVHARTGSRPSIICQSAPELLASRANGELPGRDKTLLKHLRGCATCQTIEATLEAAEIAFEDESRVNPPEGCRDAWLELAADSAPSRSLAASDEQPGASSTGAMSGFVPDPGHPGEDPSETTRAVEARGGRETVVVTGGAGFIGSHLVDALVAEGNRVVVIDDLSSGDPELVNPEADLAVAEITDKAAIDPIFDRVSPSTIYHLAAQSSVMASVQDPRHDCEVNVRGTLNVLEAARRCHAPVTFSSTGGALYGKEAPIPTPERFIPSPLPPYGASKWAAETYVNTWANSSQLPHSILRISNVYGPRQSPHGEAGVLAIFSHALWRGERPQMYGHGQPTRDYIHVADVTEAMMRASGWRGTVNISTGIETSVEELYSILVDRLGERDRAGASTATRRRAPTFVHGPVTRRVDAPVARPNRACRGSSSHLPRTRRGIRGGTADARAITTQSISGSPLATLASTCSVSCA